MPEKETVDFLEDDKYDDPYIGLVMDCGRAGVFDKQSDIDRCLRRLKEFLTERILERDKAMRKEGRKDGFFGARKTETVGWGGVAKGLGPVYHTFEEFEEKRGKE